MAEEGFDLTERTPAEIRVVHKQSLLRLLSARHLYAVGYGDVGSSIYYALGVTALWALGAAPLAIMIAGLFFACTVLTYAELATALPEAGGSQTFARRAFGDVASFIAGWALLLDYIITTVISAYTVGPYLGHFFPVLHTSVGNLMFTSVIIVFLTVLNIIGIKESAGFSLFLAVIDILTQAVIILLGIFLVLNFPKLLHQFHLGTLPTWKNFIYGISIAMVAYTGIEAVAQLAGETRKPESAIPRSMLSTLATVLVVYLGISLIALSAVSPGELSTKWLEDPIAGIAANMPYAGKFLSPWIAVLGATILLIASNAGLIGASRVSYAMGTHYQLPQFLQKLHPRFKTPYVTLSLFALVSILIVWSARRLPVLADLYNFGAMLAFSIAHISLIGLRIREPNLERPFRLGWNLKIAGRAIPISAIVGFCATFSVWVIVVVLHVHGRNLGLAWMALGLIFFIYYRRHAHLPVAETLRIEQLEMPEYKEVKLRKILVPTLGGSSTEVVQMAVKLAKEHKGSLTALYVIETPQALPLDTFFPEKLAQADAAVHRAEAIARDQNVRMDYKILQSRSAGESIIEIAREEKFDLIVLGLKPTRGPAGLALGRTVEYVLKNAPCRVVLCSSSAS